MELIRGLHNLRARHRGCVATIGNYDGVHLGHRRVLRNLCQRARDRGVPAVVVVFEPTPLEFFRPDQAPPRLMRLREKLQALAACGVDRVLCLRFDRALAEMEPEDFIDRVLIDGLGVQHLVVGDDFRFGHRRRGDFEMLCRAGVAQGFEVARMETCEIDGERVSSSRVRAALAAGRLEEAARLLGRPYTMSGRVRSGRRLGRDLGYPTANIALHRLRSPVSGILVVAVDGVRPDGPASGVASLGTRPTVEAGGEVLLEVFLLDHEGDLYGRHLDVAFLHYLRAEERFDDLETLRERIARDVEQACQWLERNGLPPGACRAISLNGTGRSG